jgi:hypothetical protein
VADKGNTSTVRPIGKHLSHSTEVTVSASSTLPEEFGYNPLTIEPGQDADEMVFSLAIESLHFGIDYKAIPHVPRDPLF